MIFEPSAAARGHAPRDGQPIYALAANVCAAIDGETVIFLDLLRDRYWSVPVRSAPAIAGLTESGVRDPQPLIKLGLIVRAATGDVAPPPRVRAPQRTLQPRARVELAVPDILAFSLACASARHALQTRRLDRAFAGFRSRKQSRQLRDADPRRSLAAFEALRPWYPKRRICLFDSLVLMDFMLRRGLAPDLVMGVRATPFAAHCWLEFDGALVGDRSDHCASFTPIAWV